MSSENNHNDQIVELLRNAEDSLKSMKRRHREVSCSPEALKGAAKGVKESAAVSVNAAEGPKTLAQNPLFTSKKTMGGGLADAVTLEEIRAVLGDCTRCKLHSTRTNIVFGVGNPKAELMFVGEGPGADEDAQGEPFVGRAGQLLTKMIEAMGVKRKDVYIANVVKCRPPDNRFPEPDEVGACEPFLKAQISVIAPKMICALGNAAIRSLLVTKDGITKLRGRLQNYEGVPVMPTYHPSYLLRNPAAKREVWEDLQMIMAHLKWEMPKRLK